MQRYFLENVEVVNNSISIGGTDFHHIKNVMRMSVGDTIILVCGDEYDYMAKINRHIKYFRIVSF